MSANASRRTKVLWIKDDFLEQILAGRKRIEVRVAYPNIARLHPGDTLLLNARHAYRVVRVRHYANFDQMVAAEDFSLIAPDLPDPPALLAACRALYSTEKEQLGVVVLEIERLA